MARKLRITNKPPGTCLYVNLPKILIGRYTNKVRQSRIQRIKEEERI
jgi:hypothetical protein